MLNFTSLFDNFPRDVITETEDTLQSSSLEDEQQTNLTYLSKLPLSKSIKKEKIFTNIREVRSVVFIKKEKQNTKKHSNQSIKSEEFDRNYLKHSKNVKKCGLSRDQCLGVMRQISENKMDNYSEGFNFQSEMVRAKGVSSKHVILNDGDSFEESNDITTPYFNPVIHTIESYMSKKETKRCGDPTKNPQRMSFLSIRNIWTANTMGNFRGLDQQAHEQQGLSMGDAVNSNNQPNSLITQDRHENNDIFRGGSGITGYPSPNIPQDMQRQSQEAYLRQQISQQQMNSQVNPQLQQSSSLYNNNEDTSSYMMPGQEHILRSRESVQQ